MLNAVQRGPASVARPLISATTYPIFIRTPLPRSLPQHVPRTTSSVAVRSFGTSPQWRRTATAIATLEDEAIEGELEQEVFASLPPSDSQIDDATSHGPITTFEGLAQRKMVCQTVIDTITKSMGLKTMTQVQSMTINETLKGTDVLAQARTGTGKTMAFLIPVLQNIITKDPSLEKRSRLGRSGSSMDIRAIIISPTRELAEQIAVEAKKVTRDTGVIVQTAVGGSAKSLGLRKIKNEGCHILVGTPGRLNDILSDRYSQVRAPNLSAFVLDEADRLLDQGFAPDIEEIQKLLPSRRDVDRQTLLYSATVPREVMQIVRQTMKPDFKFVRTVQEGEQQTHEKVPQKLVNVGGFENLMPAIVELCLREIFPKSSVTGSPARPFKAIIYFGATADVSLASAVMENLREPGQSVFHQHPLHPAKIIQIHAKLSQQQRTRAAETFRRAESGILLSSDVTARGMDFPNVTHVIQVGVPPSEEQYVHRIGRTARGDKSGEGWLFVTDLETRQTRSRLRGMPLRIDNTLETAKVDMKKDAQLPEHAAKTLTMVGNATKMCPRGVKAASYMACLGVYSWVPDKQALIDSLNDRARYGWAMEEPPMIGRALAQKLGLSRLRGVKIGFEEFREPSDDSRGGFGRERPSFGGSRGGFGGGRGGRPSYGGDRAGRSSYGRDRDMDDRNNGADDFADPSEGRERRSTFGAGRTGSSDRNASRSSYGRGRDDRSGGRSSYSGGERGGFPSGGARGGFGGRGRGGYGRDADRGETRHGGRESRSYDQ